MENTEICRQEFTELTDNGEQEKFASSWIQNRYLPARSKALNLWNSLYAQNCDMLGLPFDEVSSSVEFVDLINSLWPKYLQAGLSEMA